MTQPPRSDELPDLLYTETENDLRAAVRDLMTERLAPGLLLERIESSDPYDSAAWHALAADLGCAGLLVPEAAGGAGASYREAAVVAEEAGRAVAPVPYLGSAVVATATLLAAAGSDPARDEDRKLLAGLADGSLTAALALPFESIPGGDLDLGARVIPGSDADAKAGTSRLSGTVPRVADALTADVLLIPADGVPLGLYVVDASAAGLARTAVPSLDATRALCDITLDNVPARRAAAGEVALAPVRAGLQAGAAMLAAELLGVADRCVEMTVAYAKERRQFARQIGSFQAVKHRLADLWVAVAQARAASRYAAACLAEDHPDVPVAVALAKAACGDVAVRAAEECVQLHGGIGFTWEHPAHLYLKRAKSGSLAYGSPDRHRAALAALVDLPAPVGP